MTKGAEMETVVHPLKPIADENSRILILGTMPSPKSREAAFYYAHPQNRFWPAMAAVLGEGLPEKNKDRAEMLRRHGIALWDVLKCCRIDGASDASIKDAEANDIAGLLRQCPKIERIFTTGAAANRLYRQLLFPQTHIEAIALPSPSSANARMRLSDLIEAYRAILG